MRRSYGLHQGVGLKHVMMVMSYITLLIRRRVTFISSSGSNKTAKLQAKVTIILVTDFLCWVPFIFVSILHNLGNIDATSWYVPLAMVLLPLNSIINPLIYEDSIGNFLKRKGKVAWISLIDLVEMLRHIWRTRNSAGAGETDDLELEVIRQDS